MAGLRRVERGPGLAAQEADGSPRDQDETDHHQGWAFEKGTYNQSHLNIGSDWALARAPLLMWPQKGALD